MLRALWLGLVIAGCTAETSPADHVASSKPEPEAPEARRGVCDEVVFTEQSSCAVHWTRECDELLLTASFRKSETPARTGTCYWHDRTTCPDCSCDYYLKVGKEGFDGGTGCLGTRDDVLHELRAACGRQRCDTGR